MTYKEFLNERRLNDSQQNYKVWLKENSEATDKQIAALQAIYFVKGLVPVALTKKGIFDFISMNPKEPDKKEPQKIEPKKEEKKEGSIVGQYFKL